MHVPIYTNTHEQYYNVTLYWMSSNSCLCLYQRTRSVLWSHIVLKVLKLMPVSLPMHTNSIMISHCINCPQTHACASTNTHKRYHNLTLYLWCTHEVHIALMMPCRRYLGIDFQPWAVPQISRVTSCFIVCMFMQAVYTSYPNTQLVCILEMLRFSSQ